MKALKIKNRQVQKLWETRDVEPEPCEPIDMELIQNSIDEIINKDFVKKILSLADLNEREQLVIKSCVLRNEKQSDVAKELDISKCRVSQIVAKALRKLRHTIIENQQALLGDQSKPLQKPSEHFDHRGDPKETVKLDKYGTAHWYLGGVLHRLGDPAVEQLNGGKAWFLFGKKHREDGPAIEFADGSREWWLHGKRHRDNGYAVEHADGTLQKWKHGVRILDPWEKL